MTLHIPVLFNEAMHYVDPKSDGIYIDCTFGAGNYTKGLLDLGAGKVISIDRDEAVVPIAEKFKSEYGERFEFHNVSYNQIGRVLEHYKEKIKGIVYDIGVSSMQIDTPERGFSFQKDGPLDMRMDQKQSLSAYDVVNNYPEVELARILFEYADERKSRIIAHAITSARQLSPITTTMQLVSVIKQATNNNLGDINPATRTFQAIRIEVNKELEHLKTSLLQAKSLLMIKGRVVVVSFHSGEDKIVKSLFNEWCGKKANLNKYLPVLQNSLLTQQFKFLHKGIIIASNKEIKANVRARSARLRAIEKLV